MNKLFKEKKHALAHYCFTIYLLVNASICFANMIQDESALNSQLFYPILSTNFFLDEFKFRIFSSATTSDVRKKLDSTLFIYAKKTYVPYVWGGKSIDVPSICTQCKTCLASARVNKTCAACQKCGIDCSNLVSAVFREADLDFPYLTSSEMLARSASDLLHGYNLIDLGRDLKFAERGDLIVQDSHVVIYLGTDTHFQLASYLHSSRKVEDDDLGVGGINEVHGRPIESFQRTVRRILRHRHLNAPNLYYKVGSEPHESTASSAQKNCSHRLGFGRADNSTCS